MRCRCSIEANDTDADADADDTETDDVIEDEVVFGSLSFSLSINFPFQLSSMTKQKFVRLGQRHFKLQHLLSRSSSSWGPSYKIY